MTLLYRPVKNSMLADFLMRWKVGIVIPILWKGNASSEGSSDISAKEECILLPTDCILFLLWPNKLER